MEDKLLRTTEAAKFLGRSLPSMYGYVSDGYIKPDKRIEGRSYYYLSTLKNFKGTLRKKGRPFGSFKVRPPLIENKIEEPASDEKARERVDKYYQDYSDMLANLLKLGDRFSDYDNKLNAFLNQTNLINCRLHELNNVFDMLSRNFATELMPILEEQRKLMPILEEQRKLRREFFINRIILIALGIAIFLLALSRIMHV